MFYFILSLIFTGGFISMIATGSPSVLMTVAGGVFLVGLVGRYFAVALPVAAGTGLLAFSLALNAGIPWIGVAEGLLLIAWAGSARLHQPAIPAALTAGFFGAMVLSLEVWRGMTGDLIDYDLRPFIAIAIAAAGSILLVPRCIESSKRVVNTRPRRMEPKGAKAFRWAGGLFTLGVLIALTGFLAGPMDTLAGNLRDAINGEEPENDLGGAPTHGTGGSNSDPDGGRQLPKTADINLDHTFQLLIRTDELADAEYLRKDQIFCRTVTFDEYRADRWLPPDSTSSVWYEDQEDGAIDGRVQIAPSPPAPVRIIDHTVYVSQAKDIVLPTLRGLFSFDLPRVIKIGTAGYGHLSRPDSPLRYRASSGVIRLDEIARNDQKPGIAIGPNVLQIPNDRTGQLLRQIAGEIADRSSSLPVKIDAVRTFLRKTTTYSTVIENPQDLPPLINFLTAEKRGYCEFYATSGALLLRALGIPSRAAYGFSGGERTDDPQTFAFFADDGHAWTEIFVDGVGWCAVDFTPPGQGAAAPPGPANPNSSTKIPENFKSLSELDGGVEPAERTTIEQGNGYGWLLTLASILFVSAILAIYLRRPEKGRKIASSNGSVYQPPPPEPGFYRLFCDAAARAGIPKLPGQTPKEHLAIVAETSPDRAREFQELVDYYYAVRYEGASVDRSKERTFRAMAGQFLG